jgi:hypothetical protein
MATKKSTVAAPVTPEPMARRRNPLQTPTWAAPKASDYDLEAQIRAEKFAKMEAETAKVRVICRTRGNTFEATHTELEANLLIVDVVSSNKSLFFASSDSDELTEILPKDCAKLSLTVALPISQIDDLVDNLNEMPANRNPLNPSKNAEFEILIDTSIPIVFTEESNTARAVCSYVYLDSLTTPTGTVASKESALAKIQMMGQNKAERRTNAMMVRQAAMAGTLGAVGMASTPSPAETVLSTDANPVVGTIADILNETV